MPHGLAVTQMRLVLDPASVARTFLSGTILIDLPEAGLTRL